jgi:murein DD-endopeptidase MepM/ murein hydrolase activator NlpD
MHKGIDVKVYIGDTIRSAFDGKVRVVRYEAGGYGNFVVIRHNNGLETIYGHMSKQLVRENQQVRAGDPIGLGGNTGRSTGSHLHFETRLCGVALNPAILFDFRNQDVVDDSYLFRKSTYQHDSSLANRLRGVGGMSYGTNIDDDIELAIAAPEASYKQENRFHKVKRGETLFSIARKRGTTVDAIMKMNHLKKNAKLKPGQILKFN